MSDDTRVTRTVDTDLPADELWSLVGDAEGWMAWMVDHADVDVTPGARGTVVDDGVHRDVRIDRVDPAQGVAFTWWPRTSPEHVSTVELVVLPAAVGSRLRVTETYASAHAMSVARPLAWDVRAMVLAVRAVVALV